MASPIISDDCKRSYTLICSLRKDMASPMISDVSVKQNQPDDQEEVSSEPNTAGDEVIKTDEEEEDDIDYKKRTEYRPLVKAAMTRDWDKVIKTLKSKPEARRDYVDGDAETFLDVVVGYCDDKDKLKKIMDCYSKEDWEELSFWDLIGIINNIGSGGNLPAAQLLLEKFPNMPEGDPGVYHPVPYAAVRGQKTLATLYVRWTSYIDHHLDDDELVIDRFCTLVDGDLFGHALKLLKSATNSTAFTTSKKTDGPLISCIGSLAGKSHAFQDGSQLRLLDWLIYRWISVTMENKYSYENLNSTKGTIREVQTSRWNLIKTFGEKVKNIRDMKLMQLHANEMLKMICKHMNKAEDSSDFYDFVKQASLNAVKNGNYQVLVEIIRSYPAALSFEYSESAKALFHFAAELRHAKLCSLLYQLGPSEDFITGWLDDKGYNMLHYVAKLPARNRLLGSGSVIQMQREMQWFKVIESLTSPVECKRKITKKRTEEHKKEQPSAEQAGGDDRVDQNNKKSEDGKNELGRKTHNTNLKEEEKPEELTARKLFTEEHTSLKKEAEETIRGTAQSGTVVAALVATVAFAAAFTLPGGNDGNTGKPIYLNRTSFMVFVISDALALFSSTTSVMVFTVILTSPFTEEDFLVSLPLKLILALISLSFSTACMMVSFCAGLHLILSSLVKLITIPIGLLAFLPVVFFIFFQLPFLIELLTTTFGNSHLPSPEKADLIHKSLITPQGVTGKIKEMCRRMMYFLFRNQNVHESSYV